MLQSFPRVAVRNGFPRKNVVPFFGHPIISYTIRSALKTDCFDNVVVSTDDDEIEAIGLRYGANVDRRPMALGDDAATVRDVCLDFLMRQRAEGINWDVLCCLYATAVLRTTDDMRRVVSLIEPGVCEFAMGVSRADRYVHQAMVQTDDGFLKPKWPELVEQGSKKLLSYWFSNGTTYAVYVRAFEATGSFYGSSLRGYFMPQERSVDIDTPEDLERAKFYYSTRSVMS